MARKVSITGERKKTKLKPQKSRKLIRQYHVLLKRQEQFRKQGDAASADAISAELSELGGIEMYQQASISGQLDARGGDSSKLLMTWLQTRPKQPEPSLLEVGCLSVDNYCTRSKYFKHIERLDLNSQDPRIEQIDFMVKPIPDEKKRYDVVSLSLVVNFVPDAAQRGQMLKRTRSFLKDGGLLFFVLPEPCIYNSRYCSEMLINEIFRVLGFTIIEEKRTRKLVYWLLEKQPKMLSTRISKVLANDGPKRNNFCIVLP